MAKKAVKAKRQGVSLAVSRKPKAKTKKTATKPKKVLSPEEAFAKQFKKEYPIGGVYFETFIGPVRLLAVKANTATSVDVRVKAVSADPNDGEVSAIERNFTKSSMRNFDIKKFLKEANALYKKVYLS